MNQNNEFQRVTRLVPAPGESIDWAGLTATDLSPLFEQMSKTMQNPQYHRELDVMTHTRMVCEEIIKQPEYKNGSEEDRIILFWAALLHDIGKTFCTVEVDGVLTSPHHGPKGAAMARSLLWKDYGLCGSPEKQRLRESICQLIRYHSFPPHALSDKNPELSLLKLAAGGELSGGFSIGKLCALERADVRGRICSDGDEILEKIECCRLLAEDLGCLHKPYKFADDFSKRAYFKGKTRWKEHLMFNDTWGKVILMSGLPGTGKDTYVKEQYGHLPMISLDDIRRELKISPTDPQGKVVSLGHERAKEYLRRKQPFVWNATNITTQTREMQISLFEEYGASVETVFLETDWEEELRRNQNREREVPPSVIESMLLKLVLPERHESESVFWKAV